MRGILIVIILAPIWLQAQTNLIDDSTWTVGTGSAPGFSRRSTDQENIREYGTGPQGNNVLLWKVAPTVSGGGWNNTDYISIDHAKTYRLTVWAKKTNSQDGTIYLAFFCKDDGTINTALDLDGTVNGAPYPFSTDLPSLDQWYLLVAYVHDSGYASTTSIGGVYDMGGNKVDDLTDFKFSTTSKRLSHRAYLAYDTNTSDAAYFYAPTIYEINGQEPSIQDLINGSNGADTQAPTAPTLSSIGQTSTAIDLSWSGATDNVGVTGYKVFKDGVLEATLNNTTMYQVTGLNASTSYSFTVRALDAANNESPFSNAVSVTTEATSNGGGGIGESVWTEAGTVASYSGDVAIGRTSVPSGYRLAVDGHVRAREIRVDQDTWPDYVFGKDYNLMTLEEVGKHIEEKGHLPSIPSAEEVIAEGVDLGEMNRLLLEKIEQLTLYALEQQRQLENQFDQIQGLRSELSKLKEAMPEH